MDPDPQQLNISPPPHGEYTSLRHKKNQSGRHPEELEIDLLSNLTFKTSSEAHVENRAVQIVAQKCRKVKTVKEGTYFNTKSNKL